MNLYDYLAVSHFFFDNNLEKMQTLPNFWLLDQKSLKDIWFNYEKTEYGYFLNH